MRKARSARMPSILGATLIATTVPYVATANNGSGDLQSITGADTQSITGADTLSITGADTQSITGADTLSITGADTQSITGADTRSITGADTQSITGADTLSITGADTQSITGADTRSITGADTQSITGADTLSITGADSLVLSGPVDAIDTVNGVFESMGQVVMASQDMLTSMSVGDLVSVEGSVVAPGWLYADDLSISDERYIPGATEVSVTGILSSVDLATGTAKIGALTIDYTSSLGSANAPTGVVWSFGGTRPTVRGAMLSERSLAP